MNKKRGETVARWLKRLPGLESIPFNVDRRGLYRVSDLYRGYNPKKPQTWKQSFDHLVYEWTLEDPTVGEPKLRALKPYEAVAERLHDTAIGFAIDRFLSAAMMPPHSKPAVGFMGGHDTARDKAEFRQVAEIARTLRRAKFTIVSGGGPGLMEAANFGAFMAPYNDRQFERAIAMLSAHPSAVQDDWVASACEVRAVLLGNWRSREKPESESLGVPTWYYGNEPPNLFASHTGKYFYNSVREDGLVSIASGGIVFGPGSAGTVQEIFQDATLNYYRKDRRATPMVLLGADFWNPSMCRDNQSQPLEAGDPRKPVWTLLSTLAGQPKQTPFQDALKITDAPEEVVKFISEWHARVLADSPPWADRAERLKGRASAAL